MTASFCLFFGFLLVFWGFVVLLFVFSLVFVVCLMTLVWFGWWT